MYFKASKRALSLKFSVSTVHIYAGHNFIHWEKKFHHMAALLLGKNWNSHFGSLRNSWVSHTARLSRTSEPDWWVAARWVGTYISRVEIPKEAWKVQSISIIQSYRQENRYSNLSGVINRCKVYLTQQTKFNAWSDSNVECVTCIFTWQLIAGPYFWCVFP